VSITELAGYVGSVLTTGAFAPQVWRTWRTRRAEDISWGLLLVFGAGILCWSVYGWSLGSSQILVTQTGTGVGILLLIVFKARFRPPAVRQPTRPASG
jgi:MtN3 and saliva related transmembrane protein